MKNWLKKMYRWIGYFIDMWLYERACRKWIKKWSKKFRHSCKDLRTEQAVMGKADKLMGIGQAIKELIRQEIVRMIKEKKKEIFIVLKPYIKQMEKEE